ncbi:MAG: hypothetical protein AAGJ81_08885 [Verrucomicrobiota bacterium]
MKTVRDDGLPSNFLLFVGLALLGGIVLGRQFFESERHPEVLKVIVNATWILGLICYYTGFWRVIRDRGRHTSWFLLSFAGPIGVGIVYLLPKYDIKTTQTTSEPFRQI